MHLSSTHVYVNVKMRQQNVETLFPIYFAVKFKSLFGMIGRCHVSFARSKCGQSASALCLS